MFYYIATFFLQLDYSAVVVMHEASSAAKCITVVNLHYELWHWSVLGPIMIFNLFLPHVEKKIKESIFLTLIHIGGQCTVQTLFYS